MGIAIISQKLLVEILNNHIEIDGSVLCITKGCRNKYFFLTDVLGITFLSNFLTSNLKNQNHIWELLYPSFFLSCFLKANKFETLMSRLCMMIYNCSCNSPEYVYALQ
jgi:hypothetical protein